MLIATAGGAILFSIVATGIRQDNSMGWGVVFSLALLPVLFAAYGMVAVFAKVFCSLGNSPRRNSRVRRIGTAHCITAEYRGDFGRPRRPAVR